MVMRSALRRPGWGDSEEDWCPSIGRLVRCDRPLFEAPLPLPLPLPRKMCSGTRESCVLGTGLPRVSPAPPSFLSSPHIIRLALYPSRFRPLPPPVPSAWPTSL